MLTKKRNLGEKEGRKTEKGYEKQLFAPFFRESYHFTM